MKSPDLTSAKTSVRAGNGIGASLLKRAVLRQLGQLHHGQLAIIEDGERQTFGRAGSVLHAEIQVQDAAVWAMVAGNGSIGAGARFSAAVGRIPSSASPGAPPTTLSRSSIRT